MKDISPIPQNPTNEQILQYLYAYTQAMCNLSAIWGRTNEGQNDALSNDLYPFRDGFDEVLPRVIDWANSVEDMLKRKGE